MTPHDLDHGRADLSARLHRLGVSDDATDGPFAGVTAALTARVRRRRRNRAVGSVAAVASVVAAALVLVPGLPTAVLDRAEPQPAATTGVGVDGLCGLALTPGYAAPGATSIALTVTGERSTVTADETWSADVTHAAADAGGGAQSGDASLTWDDTELVLVATAGADAGHVVGVGRVPLSQGGTVRTTDGTDGTRTHNATGFVGCDGELVPAGQYRAVVVDLVDPARAVAQDLTGLKGVQRTSAALPLTVRDAKTTPAGTRRPTWLDGTSLWCGMSETDLFKAMPDAANMALDMTAWSDTRPSHAPAPQGLRLHNVGPDTDPVTVGAHPVLAWIDAGTKKVVTFGPDELATTRSLSVESGKTLDYLTTGYDTTDYCAPSSDGSYSSRIPPGRYDVVIYTRVPEGTFAGDTAFLERPGFQVRVRNDGTVTTQLDADGEAAAALALAKIGHQPAWLKGSGLTCGMTESAYERQSWPDLPLTFSGFFEPAGGRTGGELSVTAGGTVRVTVPRRAGVAWFSTTPDGRPYKLVSLGADPGAGHAVTVGTGGLLLYGSVDAPDSCAPDANGDYAQHLPAGDYWLALYVPVTTSDGSRAWLTNSGEMGVTVDSDGRVTER